MSNRKTAILEMDNDLVLFSNSVPVAYIDKSDWQLYTTAKKLQRKDERNLEQFVSHYAFLHKPKEVTQHEIESKFGSIKIRELL